MLNLFSTDHLIYLLLFIIYELLYKIVIINKLEWRIKKTIHKEQTDIVENIKALYNEKLENLKAANTNASEKLKHALDKILTLQLQHRTEERQALVNFSESCNQWVFSLSRINFNSYTLQNIDELKSKISSITNDFF